MPVRIALTCLLALGSHHAFAEDLAASRRAPDDAHRYAELAVVGGVVADGSFIEQRVCETRRNNIIGCAHLLYGHQVGGSKKGDIVFDLYGTWGYAFRRGRFDLTPRAGFSLLTTAIYAGQWFIAPFTQQVPSATDTFSMFPFEAVGDVELGYSFVHAGRFRARAELALRGHLPLFTDSKFELPSPHGLGATLGVGVGF